MNIRKALEKDIEAILEITRACGKHLAKRNIYQWNEKYPSKEVFFKDFKRDELYVLELEGTVIGCITISTFMDEEYKSVTWLTKNNNIYIHRLAIHPKHQKRGYAQFLLRYAEKYAQEHNYASIRLDTFSQNLRNIKFYTQRGYEKTGEIYFSRIKEHPFYCFELVL